MDILNERVVPIPYKVTIVYEFFINFAVEMIKDELVAKLHATVTFPPPLKSVIQRKTEGNDVVGNVAENVVEKLKDRQKRILQAIKNNPAISASTLSKLLGFNHRTIQRDLKYMQELGIIVHEGPDQGGTWKLLK